MTLHREVRYSATCEVCGETSKDVVTATGWFNTMHMSDFAKRLRALGWETGSGRFGQREERRGLNICPDCVAKRKEGE